MEFEGQYLTYEEYKALGGTLDLMPFNIAEKKARKLVDERTYSRLKKIENQVQDVKMCIFELIPITKDSYTDIHENKNISFIICSLSVVTSTDSKFFNSSAVK